MKYKAAQEVKVISNNETLNFSNKGGTLELGMEFVETPLVPGDSIFRVRVIVRDHRNAIVESRVFNCLASKLLAMSRRD